MFEEKQNERQRQMHIVVKDEGGEIPHGRISYVSIINQLDTISRHSGSMFE